MNKELIIKTIEEIEEEELELETEEIWLQNRILYIENRLEDLFILKETLWIKK